MMKRVLIIGLFLSLLFANFIFIVNAQNIIGFQGRDDYLNYEVLVPTEVKLNEEFTIEVLIRPYSNVEVNLIQIKVYGTIGNNGEWTEWVDKWEDVILYSETDYSKEKTFKIESLENEGHIYVDIIATYSCNGQSELYNANPEIITIEKNGITTIGDTSSEYDALRSTHDQYVESHSHSNAEYDLLSSNYQSSNNENTQQYLIYGLLATTVIFFVTTIFFARRKKVEKKFFHGSLEK